MPTVAPKRLKRRNPYANSFDARKNAPHKPYDRSLTNADTDANDYTETSKTAGSNPRPYARVDDNNYEDCNAQAEGSGPGAEQEAGDMPMEG